jgi:tetratricopeptide (TPR) repeat protein
MSEDQKPTPQPNDIGAWLRRWLSGRKQRSQGDVIAAQIGDQAQSVAVGKNIVQIGSITIPLVPLLLALIATLFIAAYASWLYFIPAKMNGLLNIAVAEFGEIGPDRKVRSSENGRRLSEWMFRSLETQFKDLPSEFVVLGWHDSQGFTTKRVKIGIVPGTTPEERAKEAEALAKRINADMVIYGNLVQDANGEYFEPEYYVSTLRHHAEEITGRHQLGQVIPVNSHFDIENPVMTLALNKELSIRANVLLQFTLGLMYELTDDQKDAMRAFQQAESQFDNWSDESGKEVIYLFIGRIALNLQRYDDALSAFQKAVDINPGYIRGYLGLGGTYYALAQQLAPEKRLETEDLQQALDYYHMALETAPNSPGADLLLKSYLALGTTYRLEGEAYLVLANYDNAMSDFDIATQNIQQAIGFASNDADQHLALASLALGAIYEQKAYIYQVRGDSEQARALLEEAKTAYSECIVHADAVPIPWYQNFKTKYCLPYKQAVEKELSAQPPSGK